MHLTDNLKKILRLKKKRMVNMRAVFSAVTAKAIALYDPLYSTQTYKFISQKLMIFFRFYGHLRFY